MTSVGKSCGGWAISGSQTNNSPKWTGSLTTLLGIHGEQEQESSATERNTLGLLSLRCTGYDSAKVFSRIGLNMIAPQIQTLIQASRPHHAIGFRIRITPLTGARRTSSIGFQPAQHRDYESILKLEEIDGEPGPWLLLDGFIEQGQEGDDRLIFTFLRCLLAGPSELQQVFTEYDRRPYPGNMAIPDPITDTNTFAGEIPWSTRFAYPLRDENGAAERQIVMAFETYGPDRQEGVPVELPVTHFVWEGSLDSSVNQVRSAMVPSPALCEQLGLINHPQQFDLFDSEGSIASICLIREQGKTSTRLLYIREDLLGRYAAETGQTIAWLVWGERTSSYAAWERLEREILQNVYSKYAHIHKRSYVWNGRRPEIRNELETEDLK